MATRNKPRPIVEVPRSSAPILSGRKKEHFCIAVLLIAAAFLLLVNLGNQYLWQDEAQTACIAKTVLQYGVPHGYDGKNYFSQEVGAEYGPNYIWRWHTWLPFYVLALFFKLFGTSTFVARFPFALFGIGTVLMGYYLGKELWRSRRAGVLTAVLLLLSVPFLVLMKQCRYYSMSAFFTFWGLYEFLGMLEGRKRSGLWFAVASVLLFQTHYLYYGALAATTVLHTAIFRRDRLRQVLLVSGIVFLVNLPWIIWLAGASFNSSISYQMKARMAHGNRLTQLVALIWIYLLLVVRHIFPLPLLGIPAITTAAAWIRQRRFPRLNPEMFERLGLVFIFMAVTILACALLSPYPHFRYLVTLLPVSWLLVAFLVEGLMRLHWSAGIVVLVLLMFAGMTFSYLTEITSDYDGPVEGTVRYLNDHGKDTDVVVAIHEEMPLKFYTKMRVLGGLTGEDMSPGRYPKWIVLRRPNGPEEVKAVKRMLHDSKINTRRYVAITLDGYPDITFENREEPNQHYFTTVKDKGISPVKLLERVDGPAANTSGSNVLQGVGDAGR